MAEGEEYRGYVIRRRDRLGRQEWYVAEPVAGDLPEAGSETAGIPCLHGATREKVKELIDAVRDHLAAGGVLYNLREWNTSFRDKGTVQKVGPGLTGEEMKEILFAATKLGELAGLHTENFKAAAAQLRPAVTDPNAEAILLVAFRLLQAVIELQAAYADPVLHQFHREGG